LARHLTALLTKVAEAKDTLKELEAIEIIANAAEKDAWRNYREANHA